MIVIDKYVKFLVKHSITERQLLVLILAYHNRLDLIELYKKSFGIKNLLEPKDKEVLKRKGFVKEDSLGRIVLTKEFKAEFADKDVITDEIFTNFPLLMVEENGVELPTANIDRSIFANLYILAISHSSQEHEEVLLDIEYGKEHGLLNIGIEKFLKSKYWLSIRKKRLSANI